MKEIKFGYEIPSGEEVYIPLHHTIITGVTQQAGKTTALEGMIARSKLTAIAFRIKRGEIGFTTIGRRIQPVFRERADWRYVESIIEAIMREPQRYNRAQIIKACRGAKTLRDVWERIKFQLAKVREGSYLESVYTNLDAYLQIVVPRIEQMNFAKTLDLKPGINVVDMSGWEPELQYLVLASVIEEVHENHRNVVVVIPEAWEFIPVRRKTPVKLAAERLARMGAAVGNYVYLDSQNIMGIDPDIRSQLGVWILGVQRYEHEVKRTLNALALPPRLKPRPEDIMRLKLGEFYISTADTVVKAYAQPAWLPDEVAIKVAKGELDPRSPEVQKYKPKIPVEPEEILTSLWSKADELEKKVKQLYERMEAIT